MKKLIYSLILISALSIACVSAQKLWCNPNTSYTLDTITYNPVLPYNVGTQWIVSADTLSESLGNIVDSFSTVIPIGFTFNFYGMDYNSVVLAKHGYITFDTSLALKPATHCFNGLTGINNSINLFAIQILLMKPALIGTIKYSTVGIAPNRQFIVSYDSVTLAVSYFPGMPPSSYVHFTGQIVLYETSSVIEMYTSQINWSDLDDAAPACITVSAIIGIQDSGYVNGPNPLLGPFNINDFGQNNSGMRYTQHNVPYPASTPICMVSVDSSTNKNMVIWNKQGSLPIDSFIIYRETHPGSYAYAQVGAQLYSVNSTFIDTGSNPSQQASRYELGFRDSCGLVAASSIEQRTINLSINQTGDTCKVAWNGYEGNPTIGTYNLYRGTTSAANMTLLSTSPANPYIDADAPTGTVYYAIGINVKACNDTLMTLSNIVSSPHPVSSPICIVSVDSATNKNMVVWDKPQGVPIDSFYIYKETNVAGVYIQIGAQSYNTYSTFIDTASNPAQQSNRYKLRYQDNFSLVSNLSAEHKTIHLSISQGIGNTWNLGWDAYEGISFGSYNLYRGTSPSNMTLLTTIASNLFSYTDLNPPPGDVYYAIGIDVSGGCNPTARTSGITTTLSNIVTNHVTGLPSLVNESSINIFPNPATETMNVQLKLNTKTNLVLIINDITGRTISEYIYNDVANLFEQRIDCANLAKGIYFVQIKAQDESYNRKIIVN